MVEYEKNLNRYSFSSQGHHSEFLSLVTGEVTVPISKELYLVESITKRHI